MGLAEAWEKLIEALPQGYTVGLHRLSITDSYVVTILNEDGWVASYIGDDDGSESLASSLRLAGRAYGARS